MNRTKLAHHRAQQRISANNNTIINLQFHRNEKFGSRATLHHLSCYNLFQLSLSNSITYPNGSASAIQTKLLTTSHIGMQLQSKTKPLSNNITYPNGSADAIQTKLYLCSLSERLSRCNPDETSNYKIYPNGSADAIQKKS